MKAKSKIIQLINEIVPGAKYTANKMRPLLTDIIARSLAEEYDAHSSLTSLDVGKLVVISNGKVMLPIEIQEQQMVYPEFELTASGSIDLPTTRIDYLTFAQVPVDSTMSIASDNLEFVKDIV